MGAGDLLDLIRTRVAALSRREAAVAALVLHNPEGVLHLPLTQLAEQAGVSEPTVIRFCRSLGCAGVRDFKLRLARSLARGTPYIHAAVAPDDTAAGYSAKVIDATIAALAEVRRQTDPACLERAVDLLAGARQIAFFGLGGSGPVAQDALHKFIRMDHPAVAYNDPLLARMAVAAMARADALVLVSNTGRTTAVVEVARLARDVGVATLALTAPDSPLAHTVDLALTTAPAEDAEVYVPMASRIAHLVLIDTLAIGVALRKGPQVLERLKRVKQSLQSTRLPAPD